jgi:hypothetical protein
VGGRDLARPCGGGSFLCVHMRSRSGWRAIAMNKGRSRVFAVHASNAAGIVSLPADAGKSSDNAPLSVVHKHPICSGFQGDKVSPKTGGRIGGDTRERKGGRNGGGCCRWRRDPRSWCIEPNSAGMRGLPQAARCIDQCCRGSRCRWRRASASAVGRGCGGPAPSACSFRKALTEH